MDFSIDTDRFTKLLFGFPQIIDFDNTTYISPCDQSCHQLNKNQSKLSPDKIKSIQP